MGRYRAFSADRFLIDVVSQQDQIQEDDAHGEWYRHPLPDAAVQRGRLLRRS